MYVNPNPPPLVWLGAARNRTWDLVHFVHVLSGAKHTLYQLSYNPNTHTLHQFVLPYPFRCVSVAISCHQQEGNVAVGSEHAGVGHTSQSACPPSGLSTLLVMGSAGLAGHVVHTTTRICHVQLVHASLHALRANTAMPLPWPFIHLLGVHNSERRELLFDKQA